MHTLKIVVMLTATIALGGCGLLGLKKANLEEGYRVLCEDIG